MIYLQVTLVIVFQSALFTGIILVLSKLSIDKNDPTHVFLFFLTIIFGFAISTFVFLWMISLFYVQL